MGVPGFRLARSLLVAVADLVKISVDVVQIGRQHGKAADGDVLPIEITQRGAANRGIGRITVNRAAAEVDAGPISTTAIGGGSVETATWRLVLAPTASPSGFRGRTLRRSRLWWGSMAAPKQAGVRQSTPRQCGLLAGDPYSRSHSFLFVLQVRFNPLQQSASSRQYWPL
jgi:hypothetical protein